MLTVFTNNVFQLGTYSLKRVLGFSLSCICTVLPKPHVSGVIILCENAVFKKLKKSCFGFNVSFIIQFFIFPPQGLFKMVVLTVRPTVRFRQIVLRL